MTVFVMIPAYDEARTIEGVIIAIHKVDPDLRILVVDDGSRDLTGDLAEAAGAKVVRHSRNRGLGIAFRTGIEACLRAGADTILTMDGDGQFDPRDIPRLLAPIASGKAEMVTASRFKHRRNLRDMPWIKVLGNRIFTRLISFLTDQEFSDTQCGFRAYSREAALRLNTVGRYTYTQEVFLSLAFQDMTIAEIPCRIRPRSGGGSRLISNVWGYGANALIIIIRTLRDYRPLTFFGPAAVLAFGLGVITAVLVITRPPGTAWLTPNWPLGLLVLGILLAFLALLADMNSRLHRHTEEVLYLLKRRQFSGEDESE